MFFLNLNKKLLFLLAGLAILIPASFKAENGTLIGCHGFGGNPSNIKYLFPLLFKSKKNNPVQFDDCLIGGANLDHASCSGNNDIQSILKKINEIKGSFILAGHSRGASSIVNVLAQLSQKQLSQIEGIFLTSPFAKVEDVVDLKVNQFGLGWVPGLSKFANNYLLKFMLKKYDKDQLKPIDGLNHKNLDALKNTPITVACTSLDSLVPANSTISLINSLLKKGFKKVSYRVFSHGDHNDYMHYNESYENLQKELLDSNKVSVQEGPLKLESNFRRYWKRNLVVFSAFGVGSYYTIKYLYKKYKQYIQPK